MAHRIGTALYLAFQALCIAALIYVLTAITAFIFVSSPGLCRVYGETRVACVSVVLEWLGKYAMQFIHVSMLTGLPPLLAIPGAVFAIMAYARWQRARTGTASSGDDGRAPVRPRNLGPRIVLGVAAAIGLAGSLAGLIASLSH